MLGLEGSNGLFPIFSQISVVAEPLELAKSHLLVYRIIFRDQNRYSLRLPGAGPEANVKFERELHIDGAVWTGNRDRA